MSVLPEADKPKKKRGSSRRRFTFTLRGCGFIRDVFLLVSSDWPTELEDFVVLSDVASGLD